MPAADLVQRVADRLEEVLVGADDGAVHVEFDHGLRLADRCDLPGKVGGRQFRLGDVGGEFHHPERLAVLVEHRVIGGEDPDFLAALADPLVFGRLVFAAVEARPELAVGGAVALGLLDEHAVMLALDFGERVAHRLQEVFIGGDDGAVHLERNDRLRPADRRDLAGVLHALDLAGGDVGRKLHDLDRLAVAVEHRVVGRLDPDLLVPLADPLVFGGLVFAALERRPEIAIRRAVALRRRDEHAVMLALDFAERVAEGFQEIVVGGEDDAVHAKLDHGLRPAERVGERLVRGRIFEKLKHGRPHFRSR